MTLRADDKVWHTAFKVKAPPDRPPKQPIRKRDSQKSRRRATKGGERTNTRAQALTRNRKKQKINQEMVVRFDKHLNYR